MHAKLCFCEDVCLEKRGEKERERAKRGVELSTKQLLSIALVTTGCS